MYFKEYITNQNDFDVLVFNPVKAVFSDAAYINGGFITSPKLYFMLSNLYQMRIMRYAPTEFQGYFNNEIVKGLESLWFKQLIWLDTKLTDITDATKRGKIRTQIVNGSAAPQVFSDVNIPLTDTDYVSEKEQSVLTDNDYNIVKNIGEMFNLRLNSSWDEFLARFDFLFMKYEPIDPNYHVSVVVGPKGDTGETGAQGPKGDTGEPGAQGPQGPQGPQASYQFTLPKNTRQGIIYLTTPIVTGQGYSNLGAQFTMSFLPNNGSFSSKSEVRIRYSIATDPTTPPVAGDGDIWISGDAVSINNFVTSIVFESFTSDTFNMIMKNIGSAATDILITNYSTWNTTNNIDPSKWVIGTQQNTGIVNSQKLYSIPLQANKGGK